MTTTTKTTPAQAGAGKPLPKRLRNIDQTEFAQQIITDWMEADREAQDEGLARLIAATVHGGLFTALERFAATGQLAAEQALRELNEVVVPLEREGWVDLLGRYIISRGGRS